MSNYFQSDKIIETFNFLIQKGYKVVSQNDTNMGTSVEFSNENIRLHLSFDYRDYYFYFSIIKGKDTKYPNDIDNKNIKTFLDIGEKYVPNFSPENLFPSESNSSIIALEKNAQLLEKYGEKILTGQEWI
jgi:hypothetical protein